VRVYGQEKVREADDGIKPGVSAANPGNTDPHAVESAKRTTAHHRKTSFRDEFIKFLIAIQIDLTRELPSAPRTHHYLRMFPGVRCAHAGVYAAVRSADSGH